MLQSKFFNNGAEGFAVLGAVNGLAIGADHFNIHVRKSAVVMQGARAIQRGLSTKRWQQRVNRCSKITLLLQNFSHGLRRDGLNVSAVAECRIRHNGRGIGVDQHNSIPLFAQSFTCLRSGIIKFTTLANHNWTAANDEDCVDVFASRHGNVLRVKVLRNAAVNGLHKQTKSSEVRNILSVNLDYKLINIKSFDIIFGGGGLKMT